MNYRDYKQHSVGAYYHIYNRGNTEQNTFLDEEDFSFFITRLRQNLFPKTAETARIIQLPEGAFSLICYCLMPNHFHFLIKQNKDIPTSKLISKLCTSYSKYFNKKYNRSGHLFQDKFKQITVDSNNYLLWLSAYIHQNPKVGNLINDLAKYRWNSYPDFIGLRGDDLCDQKIILEQFKDRSAYRKFVEDNYKIIKNRKDLQRFFLDLD